MKELKLTQQFESKLGKLSLKPDKLSYIGADLSTFENLPMVAIVGTRKPTPYGKLITEKLAEDLARAGVVIVSGLALGIDGIAQQSCLSAGGRTIAVVATGLDNIGPATNRPIAKKITENNGTIISEYETGHSPRLYDFLHRNRIIAALSDIVIIPEAAEKSGSLNTAKHAKQLGIQVAAFPGNITSPMSGGTNHLLKNGAHTITNASDVLKILNIDASSNQVSLDLTGDTPEETVLLQKLALGFNDSTTLQHETLLNTVEFQTAATMLEVQGRIKQDETGLWSLS